MWRVEPNFSLNIPVMELRLHLHSKVLGIHHLERSIVLLGINRQVETAEPFQCALTQVINDLFPV